MLDIFAEARERVPMEQASTFYGYPPNRAGFIKCPFHHEKTASLKLYADHWHCFGCQRGGSVIDFVSELFSLKPLDALKRINDDFNLHLQLDRHNETSEEREQIQRRREVTQARQRFEQWKRKAEDELTRSFRFAHNALLYLDDIDKLTERAAFAIKWQPYIEYLLDILVSGTLDEQMQLFRSRREIEQLCKTILTDTPMR